MNLIVGINSITLITVFIILLATSLIIAISNHKRTYKIYISTKDLDRRLNQLECETHEKCRVVGVKGLPGVEVMTIHFMCMECGKEWQKKCTKLDFVERNAYMRYNKLTKSRAKRG